MAARIVVHKGDLDEGRRYMVDASRIRPLLTVALPVVSVMVLHEEARTYIEFADIGGARSVMMRAAADILALRPRL